MVRSLKSPTFWVAFAALVIAMGGSAFAATLINGRSIRKGTIPGDRLGKNTLRGDRVKNGALTGNDLKGNSLSGKQIAESKLGEVPKAKTAAATADSGLLGGMPPAKFQRFTGPASSPGVPQGNAIPPGYGVTGAYGCASATANCVVSLPGPAPTNITTVSPAGSGGCTGTASAPAAPPGVVCLYALTGAAGGAPLAGGNRYGFRVTLPGTGTWAYTAPTPPTE